MLRIWTLAAAAALVVAAAPRQAEVAKLSWLSGSWISETGDRWTQESWSMPRGGMMLGTGSTGRGGQAKDWEHMRIAPDEAGTLSFWGSPEGAPAVPFRLKSLTASEAVFENPRHDYPQRIAYRREGKTLVATISAADGTRAVSWRYRRVRR